MNDLCLGQKFAQHGGPKPEAAEDNVEEYQQNQIVEEISLEVEFEGPNDEIDDEAFSESVDKALQQIVDEAVESLAYKTFKSPFVPGWLHLCVILGGDPLNKLQGLFFVTNVHFELHLELQLFFDFGLFQDLLLLYSVLEPFWKRINQETLFFKWSVLIFPLKPIFGRIHVASSGSDKKLTVY